LRIETIQKRYRLSTKDCEARQVSVDECADDGVDEIGAAMSVEGTLVERIGKVAVEFANEESLFALCLSAGLQYTQELIPLLFHVGWQGSCYHREGTVCP